jgi:alkaline phosphatase
MGENHRIAAAWLEKGQGGLLEMDDMPHGGWARTASAYSQTTDSAAAATAMATGVKTANNRIGVDPKGQTLETILEYAHDLGMATGLITTVQLSHATPAAFGSHVQSRDDMLEIGSQMLALGINVLMGGGENEFLPESVEGCYPEPGKRDDGRNLINEAINSGYDFVCSQAEFSDLDPLTTTHLLGLFADEELLRPYQPSLSDMTELAIAILSQDPDGFFLMVEGGQIDWASHGWDALKAMEDTIGLDEAVGIAKQFAAAELRTLIIVTADHETGGMKLELLDQGLTGGRSEFVMPDDTAFKVTWSTSSHTDSDIPTTAQGPGAELLSGRYENTHIFEVMRTALWLP